MDNNKLCKQVKDNCKGRVCILAMESQGNAGNSQVWLSQNEIRNKEGISQVSDIPFTFVQKQDKLNNLSQNLHMLSF